MTDYSRQHDFSVKDALLADNPLKVISGEEVDDEFDAIATHVATKADTASPTFTGTVTLTGTTLVGVFPAGMVTPYAGTTEPSGWVFCDGSAYDSVGDTSFAALYTAIGNTYGGTDGTDFTVPDLRGRAIFGKDNMDGAGGTGGGDAARLTSGSAGGVDGDTLGDSGGVEEHTLTSAESGLPAHQHLIVKDALAGLTAASGGGWANTGFGFPSNSNTNSNSAANASSAHTNIPPALVLNYIIKK